MAAPPCLSRACRWGAAVRDVGRVIAAAAIPGGAGAVLSAARRSRIACFVYIGIGTPTLNPRSRTIEERCMSQRDSRRRDRSRTRQPNARSGKPDTAVIASDVDEEQSATAAWFDRLMERATHPGSVTYALVFAVVVAAWKWPLAVVDPTSVHGTVRDVVPWIIAGVAALCFSTLTALLYSLALAGSAEAVKKFAAAVLNRAGIGAALGGLVSIRVAPALLGKPNDGPDTPFAEYLSNAGNIITMFTFILIATTWLYSLIALSKASVAFVRRIQWLQQFSDTLFVERVVPTAIMIGINLTAFLLARIVYLEIHRL
jgi:hypothetical protein